VKEEFLNDAAFDVKRAWQQTKQALHSMSVQERKQTLVESGILTKGGNVAKPYTKTFKSAK
jgi:hypothetical protein